MSLRAGEPFHAFGHDLIAWLQGARTPLLDGVAHGLSFLGDEPFYLLLIPVLYWTVDRALALRLTVLLLVSTWLNGTAKALVDLPRPSPAEVDVLVHEPTGGVPSGHAQNAVVVWGYLASVRPTVWTVGGAVLAALAIGASRLYLGVHFLQDLAAGWLLGLVILFVFLRYRARAEDVLGGFVRDSAAGTLPPSSSGTSAQRAPAQGGSAQVASAQRASAQGGVATSSPTPGGWVLLLLLAGGIPLLMLLLYREHEALPAAAALLGAGLGAVWERTRIRFSARGPLLHLVPRLVLGFAVALFIWMGLREPLAGLGDPGRVFRYALLGAWITAGAPLLFIALGIGERDGGR